MGSEASFFQDALAPRSDIKDRGSVDVASLPAASVIPSERSDEQLISDIYGGRKEALSAIFRRYAEPIRNIGLKILRNQQEAEDLVQEVLLTVYRSAAQFKPATQKAGTWIVHIAYQRAFDRNRYLNTRRFCTEVSLSDVHSESFLPATRSEAADQVVAGIICTELLRKYEQHLTTDQRLVIHLFYFEGYTLTEIAPILGQTAGNVRNHLYRGLDRLRRSILPEMSRSK